MLEFNCERKLDFLSRRQKLKLSKFFKEPEKNAMPHQLAVLLGIRYSHALLILTILEANGFIKNHLVIYHICDPEIPAGAIPYGTGFPKLPWSCSLCERVVESYDELTFDLMGKTFEPVEFI